MRGGIRYAFGGSFPTLRGRMSSSRVLRIRATSAALLGDPVLAAVLLVLLGLPYLRGPVEVAATPDRGGDAAGEVGEVPAGLALRAFPPSDFRILTSRVDPLPLPPGPAPYEWLWTWQDAVAPTEWFADEEDGWPAAGVTLDASAMAAAEGDLLVLLEVPRGDALRVRLRTSSGEEVSPAGAPWETGSRAGTEALCVRWSAEARRVLGDPVAVLPPEVPGARGRFRSVFVGVERGDAGDQDDLEALVVWATTAGLMASGAADGLEAWGARRRVQVLLREIDERRARQGNLTPEEELRAFEIALRMVDVKGALREHLMPDQAAVAAPLVVRFLANLYVAHRGAQFTFDMRGPVTAARMEVLRRLRADIRREEGLYFRLVRWRLLWYLQPPVAVFGYAKDSILPKYVGDLEGDPKVPQEAAFGGVLPRFRLAYNLLGRGLVGDARYPLAAAEGDGRELLARLIRRLEEHPASPARDRELAAARALQRETGGAR